MPQTKGSLSDFAQHRNQQQRSTIVHLQADPDTDGIATTAERVAGKISESNAAIVEGLSSLNYGTEDGTTVIVNSSALDEQEALQKWQRVNLTTCLNTVIVGESVKAPVLRRIDIQAIPRGAELEILRVVKSDYTATPRKIEWGYENV
jgi:hypothetical protein